MSAAPQPGPNDASSSSGGKPAIFRAAILYIQLGFNVVALHPCSKRPIEMGWQKIEIREEDVPRRFPPNGNVGVMLGTSKIGIVADVDCDTPEARAIASCWLAQTSAWFGRASAPFSHAIYLLDVPARTERYTDPLDSKITLIEFRCLTKDGDPGVQTMFEPSIHPDTGERVRWETDAPLPPARVSAEELRERVREIAAMTLLARHWVPEDYRHHACNALAGGLAHAGWDEEKAVRFVSLVVENAATSDFAHLQQAPRNVRDTFAKFRQGAAVTGWPRLIELGVDERIAQTILKWLHLSGSSTAGNRLGAPREWGDLLPIENPLPPVDPFDMRLLPEPFRPFVEDAAQRMQAPPDFIAAPLEVALAGAAGRRIRIYPKREDETWVVVPNLSGATIAPPGFLKTPTQESALRPLRQIEADYVKDYKTAWEQYELDKREDEQRLKAWDQLCTTAYKKGKTPPPRPKKKAVEPVERRCICNDATWEAMHKILSVNPAGILVVRDELAGWLALLDRPGREGERAFFLEAWNGTGSYTMDRIGPGRSGHTEACCISLYGGIQPGRLRAYLANAVDGGSGDDGLIQRLQIVVWPDLRRWSYVDRKPNQAAEQPVFDAFQRLVMLDPAQPLVYHFDDEAQQLFIEWIEELANEISNADLHPALAGHLSKYRSLMPSIAGLHQFVTDPVAIYISLACAQQAAAYCSYLKSHAKRLYASILSPELAAAHRLSEKIRTRTLGEKFTVKDVYDRQWSGLRSPDEARSALAVLRDAHWVRPTGEGEEKRVGRPAETFEVNPEVFAAKKQDESEAKCPEEETEEPELGPEVEDL